MRSISIVGIGRVGGALAIGLTRAGYVIDKLVHRDPSVARSLLPHLSGDVTLASIHDLTEIASDVVIITTADPDIRSTAAAIADKLSEQAVVFHTSGSLSSDVLADVRTGDRRIGSLHPLVSISDPISGADKFDGVYFCIEGDPEADDAAKAIATSLGGKTFSIAPENKALYHAAAVMSAGHVTALMDLAVSMLSECNVDPTTAKEVLLPLVASSINNLQKQSPEEALTGSFARADKAAVERHLAAFKGPLGDRARDVYVLLGEHSLDLAESNGVSPEAVEKVRQVISVAKRKSGC